MNAEVLIKENELLKVRLFGLLKKIKPLDGGQGIRGNFFHQLVFAGNPPLSGAIPINLTNTDFVFIYPTEFFQIIIRTLLSLGLDVNAKDSYFEQTPLCAAIGFDNEPLALALLHFNQQIDLNEPCKDSWCATTPLLMAIQRGNTKIAQKLIELGADINKADKFGMTPLHWAVIMGDKQTLQLLLSKNDITIKQALNGKYPMDYLNIDSKDLDIPPGTSNGNKTNAPEFRPLIAHFWANREAFYKLRESRSEEIKVCAELFQLKQQPQQRLSK
jgi:ankyrin repeat protein